MKTEIINYCYKDITELVSINMGFSPSLKKELPYIKYKEFMDELRCLDGKNVEINFTCQMDFISSSGVKVGRINVKDDKIRFFEGRSRTKFYYLDGGLFEGWVAHICPMILKIKN